MNNGSASNLIRVQANDAVFLLKALGDLVGIADLPIAAPAALAWASVSPSPARPGVETVRLVLAAREAVAADIVLYDARGRRVRTLFHGTLPAGPTTLAWDGRDDGGRVVAPGLYFARARAGASEAVRKLVLR